ncbi:hypothetical protein DERP_013444 [Dermatophagoides pteronyssinus]|uniref:Uncharacterized protein n=1 Tax=Dermatophagoides pteronyssinus TaxID=6956 RepID=A0ABQ8JRH1_DERPT|nr:hypothetical protein DERP_013444 [Dermatophagoides pteronyssinus]
MIDQLISLTLLLIAFIHSNRFVTFFFIEFFFSFIIENFDFQIKHTMGNNQEKSHKTSCHDHHYYYEQH